ncbi:MAG: ATP-binding protein [Rhodopirellula sp.]|nr:ATP-binding protein [Rhodopirellula sp.]
MLRLQIEPPAGNTRGPVYTESLLRALHRANPARHQLVLELGTFNGGVGLAVTCPDELKAVFLQEFQDAYPGVTIRVLPAGSETTSPATQSSIRRTRTLRLNPDVFPLRTWEAFLDDTDQRMFADPVAGLLSAIRTGSSGRLTCRIELWLRPASAGRQRAAARTAARCRRDFPLRILRRVFWFYATSYSHVDRVFAWLLSRFAKHLTQERRLEDTKSSEPLFECWLHLTVTAPGEATSVADRKLREVAGAFGRFNQPDAGFIVSRLWHGRGPVRPRRLGFLLSPREIATLWHPVTESADSVSRLQTSDFREVEPPLTLLTRQNNTSDTLLGRVRFREQRNRFGITQDDLRRHLLAIGKTGCGKSTFLFNLVLQQIEAGRGVILIDPHGQLAEDVLHHIPKRRTNDVIVFDAGDRLAPVGFNPLIGPPGTDPSLIADGVLTAFKNVFGFDEATAPRLLHIFRNSLLSLSGRPDASLLTVQRLLTDALFRKTVIAGVTNPAVRDFWLTEFNRWNERDRTQYIASLQNKLGAFTTNEQLQAILGSTDRGLHLRTAMDNSQIVIANLSKGRIGHDPSRLLGSLLLSSIHLAAMSRADVPEAQRRDCVIVVDEFHAYLADGNTTIADALAESRKYRTSYVLSTQLLDQLDAATLAGVLGNCGSTLCMTVGPRDAEILSELLASGLTPEDLMRVPKYHAYLRLLVQGSPRTFSMTTLSPPRHVGNRASTVRRVSRERYGHQMPNPADGLRLNNKKPANPLAQT